MDELLRELPDEDDLELDLDFIPEDEEACPPGDFDEAEDDGEGSAEVASNSASSIFRQTRTNLDLSHKTVEELGHAAQVGGLDDEGEDDYNTYVNFLDKLNGAEDLPEEEESDDEFELQKRGFDKTVFDRPRTRTNHDLTNNDVYTLGRPVQVGSGHDWEDGGRAYTSYLDFLNTLKANKDLPEEEGSDNEWQHNSDFEYDYVGPQADDPDENSSASEDEGSPSSCSDMASTSSDSSFDEDASAYRRVFRPDEASAEEAVASHHRPAVRLSEEQIREIYMQVHSHTQLLLQTLVTRYNKDPGEGLVGAQGCGDGSEQGTPREKLENGAQGRREPTPLAMLEDLCQRNHRSSRQAACGGPPVSVQGLVRDWIKRDVFTSDHLEWIASSGSPQTVWSNALVTRLGSVVFNLRKNCFTTERSSKTLLVDLGRYLNKDLVLTEKNPKDLAMRSVTQLFSPTEDSLLARSISIHGLKFHLISRNHLPCYTEEQVRLRVGNLMQRCKGNKVYETVLRLRTQPLDEREAGIIRKGIENHGFNWMEIQNSHHELPREWKWLPKLWKQRTDVSARDRKFTEKVEEKERKAREADKAKKREQRERERRLKREAKAQQEAEEKKMREEEKKRKKMAVKEEREKMAREKKKAKEVGRRAAVTSGGHKGRKLGAADQVPSASPSELTEEEDEGEEGIQSMEYDAPIDSHPLLSHLSSGAPLHSSQNGAQPPRQFVEPMQWGPHHDRVILNAVRDHGDVSYSIHVAWEEMGGHDKSPFTQQEISQRWQWIASKFSQGEI